MPGEQAHLALAKQVAQHYRNNKERSGSSYRGLSSKKGDSNRAVKKEFRKNFRIGIAELSIMN
jgi:hypothetical protein